MKKKVQYGIGTVAYYDLTEENNNRDNLPYKETKSIIVGQLENEKKYPIVVEVTKDGLIFDFLSGSLIGTTEMLNIDNCESLQYPIQIKTINFTNKDRIIQYLNSLSENSINSYIKKINSIKKASMSLLASQNAFDNSIRFTPLVKRLKNKFKNKENN